MSGFFAVWVRNVHLALFNTHSLLLRDWCVVYLHYMWTGLCGDWFWGNSKCYYRWWTGMQDLSHYNTFSSWGKACLDEACDYRLTHSSSGPCLLLLYHWTSQASQLKSCERFTHLCLVVHRPLHSLHYCTEWRYDPTLVNRFQSTWEHPPPISS